MKSEMHTDGVLWHVSILARTADAIVMRYLVCKATTVNTSHWHPIQSFLWVPWHYGGHTGSHIVCFLKGSMNRLRPGEAFKRPSHNYISLQVHYMHKEETCLLCNSDPALSMAPEREGQSTHSWKTHLMRLVVFRMTQVNIYFPLRADKSRLQEAQRQRRKAGNGTRLRGSSSERRERKGFWEPCRAARMLAPLLSTSDPFMHFQW